jgi:hypothetical protein
VITKRPSYRVRRVGGAGLTLGVVAAALVALPTGAAAAAVPAFGTTWVTSQSGNSVTELSPGGAVLATITGGATGLSDPQGVAADAAGHAFVANLGNDSITEYAAGAKGNVAPIATIAGSDTGLAGPTGLALQGTNLWVTDETSDTLEEFAAGSDGNVLPYQTIYGSKTKLDNPVGVFMAGDEFDASLWVVNDPTGRLPSVEAFNALSGGNQRPTSRISGSKTRLSDPRAVVALIGKRFIQRIVVANAGSNAITEYDGFADTNQAPQVTVSGSATKLHGPTALGLDAIGRLSVANATDGAVHVFAPGAHGNAAPTSSVAGPTDPGGDAVLAATPGLPRAVIATPANGAVHLSWTAPSNTGGGVLGYQVFVEHLTKHGGSVSFSGTPFTTTATHITEHHLKNGSKYRFGVAAVNQFGTSNFTKPVAATPATVPGAPRAVKLTPRTDALAVTWKAPKSNGGRAIGHYIVKYATCTIGAKGCHAPSITVKGSKTALTLTGLSAGTSYHVVVTAKNSRGLGKPSKPVTGAPTG